MATNLVQYNQSNHPNLFNQEITQEKKIKEHHAWFLDTVSLFKPPNQKSREALDSSRLKIGLHQITVETDKKEAALKISSALVKISFSGPYANFGTEVILLPGWPVCLDEVQSYILVDRTTDQKSIVADGVFRELPHLVMLQYYLERQCLIKCTRQLIMQALYVAARSQDASIVDEAQKLISDGLDRKLFSVLQENLSSNFPENMDVELYTLWAEEIVTEDNLILDVLFLIFYEFCPCTGELWKNLCSLYEGFISSSYNFGKLAVSAEAEIDHIGYVRQAFEAGSLSSFLEIIENDILRDFDESLCTQFWDRESFVDGPIRCLLCNLEGEFPFRTAELLQLLSALCEGEWPAECVFNFLDKSTGLSSPVNISSCSVVDDASQTVMVVQPLHLPGIEGLVIPSGTRGHLLKMIDRDIALVRWEFSQSGVFLLLLRLSQGLYLEKTSEIFMTLGLLSRLVTFNMSPSITPAHIQTSTSVNLKDPTRPST
ncbi:hypothetical protein RND71_005796 [Anisodus tanguticus]|uniref:Uncharacterized protein n=1 Tax=Anisodus tanguticus TaxID=243964 RepID=A0AAE1SQS1_9SOLA|nr:hypothetical protein RND71_005796 [Anisodus tanguticus]